MPGSSLISATYDLLSFDGYGNYSKFDRCFSKACDHASLNIDDVSRRKLRNFAFYFLRVSGHLDVSYAGMGSRWSVAPESLVQRSDDEFVIIGSTRTIELISNLGPSGKVREFREQENLGLPPHIFLYPAMSVVSATPAEAKEISRQSGVSLSLQYQESLFERLPSARSILESALTRADSGPLFEPGSTQKYDFTEATWIPCNEIRPLSPGVFRREFDYAPPEYFIASFAGRNILEISKVIEREWVLLSALAKLGITMTIRYSPTQKRLDVPRKHRDLRLPTLLERCFRSGALRNPEISQDWTTYTNISQRSVWKMAAKLPILKVEVL